MLNPNPRVPTEAFAAPAGRLLGAMFLLAAAAVAPAQEDTFQGNGLFSLPRSQDDIFEWRTAREDIQQGKFTEAVERLHALLTSQRHGVVPLQEGVDRYLGQRTAVIQTLRDLPEEGLAAYERLTAREAGGLVRSAFAGNRPSELQALADGFPTADAGRRAQLRLAAMALERGDAAQAVHHYLAALDATSRSHEAYPRIQQHLLLARGLAEGDRSVATRSPEVSALVERARTSLPDAGSELNWNDQYGHPRRPFSAPKGQIRLRAQHAVEPYGFEGNEFAVHPVGGAFGVYVTDGERIVAIDPFTRTPVWEAEGPFVRENENRNDYAGQFNTNSVLAPAIDDEVVVASLLVPSPGENAKVRAFDVILKIPVRRLVAFDRITGKQLWTHYDTRNGPITRRFASHLACGPPVIVGDTVYVASHDQTGSIAFYLAAYDKKTGEPRWRRLICSSQLEVNMFGNARFEFAASALAIEGGVIYGTSNLGVCFAADQADGNLRWVSAYEVTQMPPTRLTHQEERAVFFANNPVILADGVMACTPLDSQFILGIDCETGRLLWRQHYISRVGDDYNHVQWLLGAIGDEFIVSGVGVLAIKARTDRTSLQPSVRLVRSRESLGIDPILDQPPRGAVVEGKIWFPRITGISVFDQHGTTDATASALLRSQPAGNLLVTDGMVVSALRRSIDIFYDLELLVQQADRRYREHQDDPLAALDYAHLLRAQAGENIEGPTAERAAEVLRRGLEASRKVGLSTESPVFAQLAGSLFDLSLLRADSIAKRDAERALTQLRQARDGAPNDERWLDAQRRILTLVRGPAAQIAELTRIEERLGDRVVRFDAGREMPAAAYARWQIAEREANPERALIGWQALLEHWPGVALDGVAARDVAIAMIDRLIARNGVATYAVVEARAKQALASASGDARALSDVIERFPHSDAANGAVRSLMDLALTQGDLEAAVRCFRHGRQRPDIAPGLYRRLLEAARAAGNLRFAAALGDRLHTQYGAVPSDLARDGGKPYRDIERIVLPPTGTPPPPVERPTHKVADLVPLVIGNRLQCVPVEAIAGFKQPKAIPLFLWEGGTALRAHAVDGTPAQMVEPLYTLDCPRLTPLEPLHVCGNRMLIVEQDRVRGVELEDGALQWTRLAGDGRAFYSLGVQAGLLQIFSEHTSAADGGRLLGIEPLTGAVIYERIFGGQEASLSPVAAGGSLWSLRPEPDDQKRIWLEEIDPLSGESLTRVMLSDPVRRLLQLPDDFAVHGSLIRILSHLFVHDDVVVLAADGVSESVDRPPGLVALARDGSVRWQWRGSPRRAIVSLWHRANMIAVYEAGSQPGGQIVLLDAHSSGRVVDRVGELNGSLQALSAVRPLHQDKEAPPALVLAMRNRSGWSLVCRSITAKKPAFHASITADGELANPTGEPVFGADFVMIAVSMIGQSESYLHTFDLATGAEQRRRLPGQQVNKITAQDGTIALETTRGISILGNRGTPLR